MRFFLFFFFLGVGDGFPAKEATNGRPTFIVSEHKNKWIFVCPFVVFFFFYLINELKLGVKTERIMVKLYSYSFFYFSDTDMEWISDGYDYESKSDRIFIKLILKNIKKILNFVIFI